MSTRRSLDAANNNWDAKMHSRIKLRSLALAAIAVMGVLLTLLPMPAPAAEWRPTTLFIQAGTGEQHTHEYFAGASWAAPWWHESRRFTLSAYVETGLGRWVANRAGHESSAWLTQLSATPVLRARPHGAAGRWFGELGIGANLILPVYQSGRKRFSTEFNFGDHIAIGRNLGRREQHEVSLRLEHFSNAGIQEPNPGENFLQLRYAYYLGR